MRAMPTVHRYVNTYIHFVAALLSALTPLQLPQQKRSQDLTAYLENIVPKAVIPLITTILKSFKHSFYKDYAEERCKRWDMNGAIFQGAWQIIESYESRLQVQLRHRSNTCKPYARCSVTLWDMCHNWTTKYVTGAWACPGSKIHLRARRGLGSRPFWILSDGRLSHRVHMFCIGVALIVRLFNIVHLICWPSTDTWQCFKWG